MSGAQQGIATVLLQREENNRKKMSLLLCCSEGFCPSHVSHITSSSHFHIFVFSFDSLHGRNNAEYRCSCIHSFTDHFSEYHTQALSFPKYKSKLVTLITLGFLRCSGEMGFRYPAYVKRSS